MHILLITQDWYASFIDEKLIYNLWNLFFYKLCKKVALNFMEYGFAIFASGKSSYLPCPIGYLMWSFFAVFLSLWKWKMPNWPDGRGCSLNSMITRACAAASGQLWCLNTYFEKKRMLTSDPRHFVHSQMSFFFYSVHFNVSLWQKFLYLFVCSFSYLIGFDSSKNFQKRNTLRVSNVHVLPNSRIVRRVIFIFRVSLSPMPICSSIFLW